MGPFTKAIIGGSNLSKYVHVLDELKKNLNICV